MSIMRTKPSRHQCATMLIFEKYIAICVLSVVTVWAVTYEKRSYFAIEHPTVVYRNPKYLSFVNVTSRRHSRKDPVHYFNMRFITTVEIGNNFTFSFYFYEWLTNVYKPSFVEFHKKGCSQFQQDPVFGATVHRALLKIVPDFKCPLKPGDYNLQNLTMDIAIMKNFPFQRGRIIGNMTVSGTGELVINAYVDFQIKEMKVVKA